VRAFQRNKHPVADAVTNKKDRYCFATRVPATPSKQRKCTAITMKTKNVADMQIV
jgi:hypothetical protein